MAVQTTEEFKNGGTTSYPITIEYLKPADIIVRIDGALQTYVTGTPSSGEYKVSGTTVTLGATAPSGTGNVHIYRETSVNTAAAVFQPGSSIRAVDLNNIHDMARFASVEHRNKIITDDIRDGQITSDKIKDGSITGADISNSAAIPFAKLATGLLPSAITVNTNNIVNGSITADDLATGTLDNRYFTETESDARYFRQDSSETISSGTAWSSADTHIATTAAINARIIDLIEEVGGFVPLANETSFPDANPDINNGNGTIVSIQAVSTDLVPTGGAVTIANGRGTGKPVTITGVTDTIPATFGMLIETTTTNHTYAFHRLTAKATEVNTVAQNITTIQAVNANQSNINAVNSNKGNIDKVVGNEVNINLVSGELSPLATDLGFITNPLNTTASGNDINTVADNIQDVKDVAQGLEDNTLFLVDSTNKTAGSVVYYDGTQFKADTTTTKNTLVTGGNF